MPRSDTLYSMFRLLKGSKLFHTVKCKVKGVKLGRKKRRKKGCKLKTKLPLQVNPAMASAFSEQLYERFPLLNFSSSESSLACFANCQRCYLPSSFHLFFPILLKHKLRHNVSSESEFYFANWWHACFALIIMTFAVDWALCIRNHSISQFKCPKFSNWKERFYPIKNKLKKWRINIAKWFKLRTVPPKSNTLFWKENG